MNQNPFDGRPPDANADRGKMYLQCIGSFNARGEEGRLYVIEIWTHFGAVHDRERQRVTPTQLVLTTTDGWGVDRIDQGTYRMHHKPEIILTSDDPNAP